MSLPVGVKTSWKGKKSRETEFLCPPCSTPLSCSRSYLQAAFYSSPQQPQNSLHEGRNFAALILKVQQEGSSGFLICMCSWECEESTTPGVWEKPYNSQTSTYYELSNLAITYTLDCLHCFYKSTIAFTFFWLKVDSCQASTKVFASERGSISL